MESFIDDRNHEIVAKNVPSRDCRVQISGHIVCSAFPMILGVLGLVKTNLAYARARPQEL